MAVCSGLEYANNKLDPVGLDLDGFSGHVFENINQFNNVLEKLVAKYSKKVSVAPEIELILLL